MKTIHLIVGVPGSGKTWIAQQLTDKFNWCPHDSYPVKDYARALEASTIASDKPVLGEVPFRASVLIEELLDLNLNVITYYIDESEATVVQRYESREGRVIPKQHITNLRKYRFRNWDHLGTSQEILDILKNIG